MVSKHHDSLRNRTFRFRFAGRSAVTATLLRVCYPASAFPRYVERLCGDLRSARDLAGRLEADLPEQVDSIYLGAGHRSILPPELFRRAVRGHSRRVSQSPGRRKSRIECAPGQIDDALLATMVECGVNRVSSGVQSFVDREAAVTGRLHNRETADSRCGTGAGSGDRVGECGPDRRAAIPDDGVLGGFAEDADGHGRESCQSLHAGSR